MSTRFVSADALPGFVQALSEGSARRILAPVVQGQAVVFAPWSPDTPLCLERPHTSPKAALLPQCETLITYERRKEDGCARLAVEARPEATPTVIFGCRPCDARGLAVLDRPYLQGPYADPYYQARREQLLVVSRACTIPCSTCFCHWVGSHPHDSEGSDILMVEVPGGFVLRPCTPRGEAELKKTSLPDGSPHTQAAAENEKQARASQAPAPDISKARKKLAALFNDMDFWQRETAACLSCGACTYFCPACYCFNITDEGDGMDGQPGRRLRTWDNCMAAHFTREASGHNARTLRAQRMRNRVSHKFSNYPAVWDAYSCTGCGRCIGQCPVHLDIRAIVLNAVKAGS